MNYLIAQGIVDSTKMGVLGWSAGGHWSNWILTHTNRFKAISTGAGTTNWISMYAESDVQRNRQFYLGNKLPYDNFDAYWNQSPIKYIKNAKTPTMIHVVHDDPRVPRPQSEELFMALRQLGVPTEFYVYPGASHGIPDPRNQLEQLEHARIAAEYGVKSWKRRSAWRAEEALDTAVGCRRRGAALRAAAPVSEGRPRRGRRSAETGGYALMFLSSHWDPSESVSAPLSRLRANAACVSTPRLLGALERTTGEAAGPHLTSRAPHDTGARAGCVLRADEPRRSWDVHVRAG